MSYLLFYVKLSFRWPGLMSHVFFYIMWTAVCVHHLPGDEMLHWKKESQQRQYDALGSVVLGNLGSSHVDVTLTWTTYINIASSPVSCEMGPPWIGLIFSSTSHRQLIRLRSGEFGGNTFNFFLCFLINSWTICLVTGSIILLKNLLDTIAMKTLVYLVCNNV